MRFIAPVFDLMARVRHRRSISSERDGDARQAHLECRMAKINRYLPRERYLGVAPLQAEHIFCRNIERERCYPSCKPG